MSAVAKLLKTQKILLPQKGPVPNRRILVIDDEPAIGDAINRMLGARVDQNTIELKSSRSRQSPSLVGADKSSEFEVVVVTNPEDALKEVTKSLMEQRPFAVGFFDVMLGAEIDGIELVKRILAIDRKMFAVFVTAYQDRTVDSIGDLLGEENREKWDYINKPFTEGEILQKARNATSLWDLHRLKDWQEERLSEAHQLLLTNERQNTVSAVARSVSHEFGNLLTHIIGNAELALENGEPARLKSAIEIILKVSDTATKMLHRFRTLHDPDDSSQTAVQEFDLRRALEESVELLDFQFRKNYIQMNLPEVTPVLVEGRRHSFVQVFVNLFINAMHAMPSGGDIFVELTKVDSSIKISVRDTGPGIPFEHLEVVTEPMFTTKGNQGSGLGLAICKEIIEIDHRGELKVHNHPLGGAEIIMTIPIKRGSDI